MISTILWLACGAGVSSLAEESARLKLAAPVRGASLFTLRSGERRPLVVGTDEGLDLVAWWDRGARLAHLPRVDARGLAYCVAGDPSRPQRVYTLTDAGVLSEWDGGEPRELVTTRGVTLPDGVYSMRFADDFDGDGRVDFAVPISSGFQLYFGDAEVPRQGPSVQHEVDVDVDLDSLASASPQLRQELTIPAFRVEDQNGDGHRDLVFRDDHQVQFYWTGKDGRIPEQPTFGIDLEEIKSQLPQRSRGIIDPGNLLKVLESQVTHLTRDFDGDGVADLLLRRGSRVSMYRGTRDRIDRERAAQVLMTAGNLLSAYALDDDGDGRDDLGLLLVSDISISQVLVWLVAGASLTFDCYVYRQEGPLRFARKPTRRRQLTIDVPSLLSLADEIGDHIDGLAEGVERVPVAADLDGDGRRDDVVRLGDGGAVEFYLDADPRDQIEEFASGWYDVVQRFDEDARGKEELKIELYDLVDWVPIPGRHLVRFLQGKSPSWTADIDDLAEVESAALFVVDLNGDGADDVVAAASVDDGVELRFLTTRN